MAEQLPASESSFDDLLMVSPTQLTTPLLPPGDEPPHELARSHATAGFAGSVFNLSAATLGAGALSLPYAVSLIGVKLALVLLVIAVVGAFLSVELLVASLDSARCNTYELVTTRRLGARAAVCVEIAILSFCFGTCVAYVMALGDIIDVLLVKPALLPSWAPHTRSQLMIAVWALLLFPISMPRSLAALQNATFGSTVALFVLVGTVCWHTARALSEAGADDVHALAPALAAAPAAADESVVGVVSRVASALSIIMFAFTCQVNVPEVYEELKGRSAAKMRRVTATALGIALALYVLIGVGAYLEFGASTKPDVLSNYDVWAPGRRDRPMLPSYALMGMAIVVAFPFNVFPARQTIMNALGASAGHELGAEDGERRSELHNGLLHVGLTVGLTGAALLVALFVPGINVVFQLLGGTASALVCFCVPGMLALRSGLPMLERRSGRLATYALVGAGGAAGVISTALTIAGLFRKQR
jgi:amino acid permease